MMVWSEETIRELRSGGEQSRPAGSEAAADSGARTHTEGAASDSGAGTHTEGAASGSGTELHTEESAVDSETASDQDTLEGPGEEHGIEDETGETSETILAEDEETAVILETEPETEYITATPTGADSASRPRSSVAEVVGRTAHNAAESAMPAVKSIAFNLVNAIIIMFIGVQIAKLFRRMIRDTLSRMHMDESLQSFLSSMIYVVTCGVSAFIALEKLGVSSASVVALLGSAGLAISLSLQDFLGNFAGGIIILTLKPFHPGDYIICESKEGTVASTGLFYTTLRTVDNRQVILPNGKLANAEIVNVTAEARRRLEISVTISYESDLRLAKEILKRLFDEHPDIYHEDEFFLFVSELGEDGVSLVARGWIDQAKYWPAKWAITEQLKLAYDEAGIEIPYRQMDVHMKEEK